MNEIRKNKEVEVDQVSMSFKMEPALILLGCLQMLLAVGLMVGGFFIIWKVQDGGFPGLILMIIGALFFIGYLLGMIFRKIGMKRSKVTVSNRRIYGVYCLYIRKRDFSYRLDEIDNVELSSFLGAKQLVINFQDGKGPRASAQVSYGNMPQGMYGSGVLRFQCVENYQEVYDKLNEMLLALKSNTDVEIDMKMARVDSENRKADALEDIANGLAGGAIAAQSASNATSYIDEIKKLKELLDCGAITQEEFDTEKKEILDGNHK